MVITIEISNNHHKFPVNKSKESGGRKIKNITSVVKNTKGKLAPTDVLKFTRRIDKITLSNVNELACKIAARIGKREFIYILRFYKIGCAREESNLHTFRHYHLKVACIPFHHS